MNKAQRIASCPDLGREVWVRRDDEAEVYELFASEACDDPIGEADTLAEARQVARWWFDELRGE